MLSLTANEASGLFLSLRIPRFLYVTWGDAGSVRAHGRPGSLSGGEVPSSLPRARHPCLVIPSGSSGWFFHSHLVNVDLVSSTYFENFPKIYTALHSVSGHFRVYQLCKATCVLGFSLLALAYNGLLLA